MLKEAGVPATVFAARDVTHDQANDRLGQSDYPGTKAMDQFLGKIVTK